MREKILAIKEEAVQAINKTTTLIDLDELRVKYTGKKGSFTEVLKGMKNIPTEDKKDVGELINSTKDEINSALNERLLFLKKQQREYQLATEILDVSLDGKKPKRGTQHPITETTIFLQGLFMKQGFDVVDGPEVEWAKYNFDYLNIPKDHPSRDETDTFYINDETLLRSQTSPVQVRYMLEHKPPFRMVCPGTVYRPDYDISHTPMFHQMEGLLIGEDISFADLKGILIQFVQEVFGDRKVRFRPHFFPFTEPSAELDVECTSCHGTGCRVCKHSGWLEIMGCGMVDPAVLEAVGYRYENLTGFAFGMGIERITMLRYGIDDLRAFFENDIRFLKQF